MNFFEDSQTAEDGTTHDVVEADVLIDASLEAVWALVSEPGWWINDGPLGDHEVSLGDDGLYRVADPEAGDWLVEKSDSDPMDVATFRWYPLAGDEFPEDAATRVEVSLSEEHGKVAVHVEESGLSAVSDDEDVAYTAWEDASGMWDEALASARRYLENRS
ncbi:toxin [Schaalia suimastitidis]|uniref:toxin n=1 Tax=Schaalia suimastitidis TaxID=121163 RepID=UPI0004106529|nr:toxin [Schaalia suimastitidis]